LVFNKPDQAEKLLREALALDLYHGPAHNNLGVIYLKQGKLYEAAGEFEWAKKLMPESADPRMNLALVLEKAGRLDDALDGYRSALAVQPEHLATMQSLARLQIRSGRPDAQTSRLLDQIALRGETDEWKNWGRLQRIKLNPVGSP